MHRRSLTFPALAAGLSAAALAAITTTALAASAPRSARQAAAKRGPAITVRIEGAKKTLLPTTTIHVPASGSVTKDGAPKGACPADSAAGALQLATKGNWSGRWYASYDDYEVLTILGETASAATATSNYWTVLDNNVATSTGVCGVKLHAGDALLFADVSPKYKNLPLVIKVAKQVKANATLKVTVDAVTPQGKDVALKGAKVTGGAHAAKTNAKGVATVTVKHSKTLTVHATDTGFIRAAPVKVKVTS